MKRILQILILSLAIATTASRAQSMEQVTKLSDYKRFGSASSMLNEILKKDMSNVKAWYVLTKTYIQKKSKGY